MSDRAPKRERNVFLVGAITKPATFLDRLVLAIALTRPQTRQRSAIAAPVAWRARRSR
jgi:hypothetical protein